MAPERPYMWASKTALRRIRDGTFDESPLKLCATYLALCEIASDEAAATFCASYGYIAAKYGQSRRSVIRAIPQLEKMGLIACRRIVSKGKKQSNKYRILTMAKAGASSAPGSNHVNVGHQSPETLVVTQDQKT